MIKNWLMFTALLGIILAAACAPAASEVTPPSDTPIPAFEHIILLVLENRSYPDVIGSSAMPRFNQLAQENALLTQYKGISHPSLPNYIALVSGDTHGIENDCTDCFIDAENIADRLEAAGRTWKTYQEDMPKPCFLGNADGKYAQKHNPFVYFDAIRLDTDRCEANVVPLSALDSDLQRGTLPNFALIVPNMCHNGHDCAAGVVDEWIGQVVDRLIASAVLQQSRYLIVVTYDESESPRGMAGLIGRFDGRTTERVATVLISPDVRAGFVDSTPYNHYSLLKTILLAWDLPALGHTADEAVRAIRAPWRE